MIWVKPPVSAGFSDEVGLIEDVDMLVWMLRLPVLVVVEVRRKPNQSFLLANANQSRQLPQ